MAKSEEAASKDSQGNMNDKANESELCDEASSQCTGRKQLTRPVGHKRDPQNYIVGMSYPQARSIARA